MFEDERNATDISTEPVQDVCESSPEEDTSADPFCNPRPTLRDRISSTAEQKYGSGELSRRDGLLLGLCFIPSILLCLIPSQWLGRFWMPAIQLCSLGIIGFALGRKRFSWQEGYLLICDIALIALGALHGNDFLVNVNLLAIPLIALLWATSVSNPKRATPFTLAAMQSSLRQGLSGLFRYAPLPLLKLISSNQKRAKGVLSVLISLFICVPILLVVILLLCDADPVFFESIRHIFSGNLLPDVKFYRYLFALALGLMLFSWCFSLRTTTPWHTHSKHKTIPAVFPSILLPLLNLVYLLFVYIQFSHLFGGAESAAMTGGYAQYARTGFFQLVLVSGLNLAVLGLSAASSKNLWLRWMASLLVAATCVILFSALWRMRLYISVYGLTVLRVLTLWGMVAIFCLILIVLASFFVRRMHTFAAATICLLALWVALNAVDIHSLIIQYNIDHYASGELEQIDLDYLRTLSPNGELPDVPEKETGPKDEATLTR